MNFRELKRERNKNVVVHIETPNKERMKQLRTWFSKKGSQRVGFLFLHFFVTLAAIVYIIYIMISSSGNKSLLQIIIILG